MKFWITHNALAPLNDKHQFWRGALYGLKRLEDAGHQLNFNDHSLTDTQMNLLDEEQISNHRRSSEDTDYTVDAEGEELTLKETGDEEAITSFNTWKELADEFLFPQRKTELHRKTGETDISLQLNIDGAGEADIDTGLSFFDHMLDQIARHGLLDIRLACDGDLEVDEHHTIEDVAIALGEAIDKALQDKRGIQRYSFVLPMDESRATMALDLSGRSYFEFEGSFEREYVGDFPTEMVEHFFHSLAMNMNATLHISVTGRNEHHMIEACFKGFARALRGAVTRSERMLNLLPSSKGVL